MGIFPFHGRATTYGYLVGKTPCYTLFDTGASKAMLNKNSVMNILFFIIILNINKCTTHSGLQMTSL